MRPEEGMKLILRQFAPRLRQLAAHFGYSIIKTSFKPGERIGLDPFNDICYFLKDRRNPLLCDVGANEGQTIAIFKNYLPHSTIHAFEPSAETYQALSFGISGYENVIAHNYGLGADDKDLEFNENSLSSMSSFLPSTHLTWGDIRKVSTARMVKLDSFATKNNIDIIDVLKMDTQGYELEVLKGSSKLLEDGRIKLIYLELTAGEMYAHLPRMSETFSLLEKTGYKLIAFYDQHFHGTFYWCDALFVHNSLCA